MLIIFASCNSVILNHRNHLSRFSALLPFSSMHYHYLLKALRVNKCALTYTRTCMLNQLSSEKVKETTFPLRILFQHGRPSHGHHRLCFSLFGVSLIDCSGVLFATFITAPFCSIYFLLEEFIQHLCEQFAKVTSVFLTARNRFIRGRGNPVESRDNAHFLIWRKEIVALECKSHLHALRPIIHRFA